MNIFIPDIRSGISFSWQEDFKKKILKMSSKLFMVSTPRTLLPSTNSCREDFYLDVFRADPLFSCILDKPYNEMLFLPSTNFLTVRENLARSYKLENCCCCSWDFTLILHLIHENPSYPQYFVFSIKYFTFS